MAADIALLLLLVALTGCTAGFLSGILGVGGGVVIVPVLYYVFVVLGFSLDAALHVAIGTSLATIMITQARSALSHRQRGSFNGMIWRDWSAPSMMGAVIGGLVAGLISGNMLAIIFGATLILVASVMIYRSLLGIFDMDELHPPRFGLKSLMRYPTAFFSGLFSAICGIGGGVFNVSALTLMFRVNIREAIGTAAGIGALIGLCGAAIFAVSGIGAAGRVPYSLGYVNVPSALLIIPFSIICAPWGVSWAHRLPQKKLQIIFAVMLIIAAANMLYEGISGAGGGAP